MVIAPVEKNQGWGAGSANFFRRHAYNKMSTALKIWERGENSGPDTDTRTDEELLLSYRRTGVPGDFARLVKRFEGEIYAYLRRYLGDRIWPRMRFRRRSCKCISNVTSLRRVVA